MMVAFPEEILKSTFNTIENASPKDSKRIWKKGQLMLDNIYRSALRIQYFKKNQDGNNIVTILKESGFKFTIKEAINEYPTNAIWYGNKIKLETVKLIASSLMKNGIKLRSIKPFKYQKSKGYLIQIGNLPGAMNKQVISPDDVLEEKF
jgi:hypothetical protein